MIAVGGLAHDVGFPIGATLLSTMLIWAAPAQVILFGLVASGATAAVIAVAICFSSVRFFPMCMSLLPIVRRPGVSTGAMVLAAHFVAVTNWVEGMKRLPPLPRPVRLPYFLGFGTMVMTCAVVSTAIGYYVVQALPPLAAAGLLFVSPIYFISALTRAVRLTADACAIVFGFALTPVGIKLLPTGFDLIAVGVVAGTAAYWIGRRARRKAFLERFSARSERGDDR